jgi:hypothetical protein
MQRIRLITLSILPCLAIVMSLPACNDDGNDEMSSETQGDGDGDPTGDGDGDPTGDGDGDPTGDGDGDGDPTGDGDGDGDPTGDGDGDGDLTGDGDGDGDGDPTGDGDGDPGLSFEADVFPIIQSNCSCHGGGSGGLTMSNATTAYDNLVSVPSVHDANTNRVEPGDAANSFLYQKITATQAGLSPTNGQMPKTAGQELSANPLSAGDMATIESWINDGAAP